MKGCQEIVVCAAVCALEATGRLPPAGDPGQVSGKGPPCMAVVPGTQACEPLTAVSPDLGGSGLRLTVPSEGQTLHSPNVCATEGPRASAVCLWKWVKGITQICF